MAVIEGGDGLCVGRYLHVVRLNVESINDKDLSVLLITVVIRNIQMAQTKNLGANKNNHLPGARSLRNEHNKFLFAPTSIWCRG